VKRPGIGAEGSSLLKDKIVEKIALEMAEGNWRPWTSVRELAARLGVGLSQSQKYAAEATRLLRLSWGQDEAKVAVLERIARLGRASEERTEEVGAFNPETGKIEIVTLRKPDLRSALAAAKHLADCLGMSGEKAEVIVRYQQMSDVELLREVSRFAQLKGSTDARIIEIDGEEIPEPGPDADGFNEEQAALARLDAEDAGRGWRSGL